MKALLNKENLDILIIVFKKQIGILYGDPENILDPIMMKRKER